MYEEWAKIFTQVCVLERIKLVRITHSEFVNTGPYGRTEHSTRLDFIIEAELDYFKPLPIDDLISWLKLKGFEIRYLKLFKCEHAFLLSDSNTGFDYRVDLNV